MNHRYCIYKYIYPSNHNQEDLYNVIDTVDGKITSFTALTKLIHYVCKKGLRSNNILPPRYKSVEHYLLCINECPGYNIVLKTNDYKEVRDTVRNLKVLEELAR